MKKAVVAIVRTPNEVGPLVTWAAHLARAQQAERLAVLHLRTRAAGNKSAADKPTADGKPGGGTGPIDLDQTSLPDTPMLQEVRRAQQAMRARSTPLPAEGWHPGDPVPDLELHVLDLGGEIDAVLRTLDSLGADLLVFGDGEGSSAEREVSRELLARAHCATLWLRSLERLRPRGLSILVPIAGGPNADAALQCAAGVAESIGGQVHALMVEPRSVPDAEAVGRHIAEKTVQRTVARHRDRISVRVALDDDPVHAITQACQQDDYAMLLVGASPFGKLRRFIAGKSDRRMREAASEHTCVAVYRRALPLTTRVGTVLDRVCREYVPQLDRAGRMELTEKIQGASTWNFDFVALIGLSTLIAAFGLVKDSAAVVIGAMLVAPLMTPLVGCGLAIVQGNARLIRGAAQAVGLGFLLAFLIGIAVGLWMGDDLDVTQQMLDRGAPDTSDLIIAVASGLAAAYATARPGLSGAIPGVAIAAALVPPIATSGLALSLGHPCHALGAFLLFFTNIIAIVLSSAISLFAVGLRVDRSREERWRLRLWLGLLVLTVLLTLYLSADTIGLCEAEPPE